MPDILVAIQFCFEGKTKIENNQSGNGYSSKPSGDLITWKFNETFQNKKIFELMGVRIVRIAVH